MRDQDKMALVRVDPVHLDPKVFFRKAGLHAFRPFHHQHSIGKYTVQVENGAVEGIIGLQSVSVAMEKRVASGRAYSLTIT